jgi:ABC-2 type transport system permease protein
MNRFPTLLKREYWEHRGGFVWAPIWTAGIMLFFCLIGMGAALWHTSGRFNGEVHVGVPLKRLIEKIPPEEYGKVSLAIDAGLSSFWMVIQIVVFFVLFFYLLGALYDDRRDRSILFWKSLPVSDAETVASKVAMAMLVVPLFAWVVTVLMHIGFLLLLSGFVLINGVSPMQVIWGPGEPLNLWIRMLAMVPLNALWALPAIGWLLLVSAFARSKPFLWAVALPVAIGVFITVFDVFQTLKIPETWYWRNIVGRILLSIMPGSWFGSDFMRDRFRKFDENGPMEVIDWNAMGNVLVSPELWIGVVAGAAMIVAAIHYRRTRELAD